MTRYHSLDSLRAAMMLLGVWLHTVVGLSRDGNWPYKDPNPTALYDWTLGVIHTFRMPLFYIMAGFFGALLWSRRGEMGFVVNRLNRILLPFVLGWAVLYPVCLTMAAYAKTWSVSQSMGYMLTGGFVRHLHPLHLWFLEYLLLLYGMAYLVVKLAGRFPPAWLWAVNRGYRRCLSTSSRPLLFAVPTFFTLWTMPGGNLQDPPGFLPVPRILLAYVGPFTFGWLLFHSRDLLPTFERHAWKQIVLAALLVVAAFLLLIPLARRSSSPAWAYLWPALRAVFFWLVAFGLTGLFHRYLNAGSPLGRYLSDGSYWIYLAHMPVVMTFQMALAGSAIPAAIKVWIVLALSTATLVASYDALVRPTWIGVLLNGRRYPRRYFGTAPQAPEPVAVQASCDSK